MKIPLRWQQLLVAELVVFFICLTCVILIGDFLDYPGHPAGKARVNDLPLVFEGDFSSTNVAAKTYWAEIIFFSLVFIGQIAIFRQRNFIFKSKQRKNG